jgi:DNA-binding NarL/FixJ family response regulator
MEQPSRNRRVVLIDDSPDFRRAAAAFLGTLQGVELAGMAADGPQGLELASRLRPDAAIVDITMPGMNGFEVAARLQQLPQAMAVILVSMEVDQATRREAGRLGIDAVIPKMDIVDELPEALAAVTLVRGGHAEG